MGNGQYWTDLLVVTQDVFFCHLTGQSAPTGLVIDHWIGWINAQV